jgi:hypothetical protein
VLTARNTLEKARYNLELAQVTTAVVAVADFLQTDDLFLLGQPRELPPCVPLRGGLAAAKPP